MPGAVNNIEDLGIVCRCCIKHNIKIVLATASNPEIDDIVRRFPTLVTNIGERAHPDILYLIQKSIGGIVLYRNDSINQRLSASSKLFEFLFFNKPVIVSDNEGVISELQESSERYRIIKNGELVVDDLFDVNPGHIGNDGYIFENEVRSNMDLFSARPESVGNLQ